MSVSLSFLRGGRPTRGNLTELVERLQPASGSTKIPYTEWLWVSFFPRQWCRENKYNRTSAPVFHALLGRAGTTTDVQADWHVLLTFCQADAYEALTPYTRTSTTSAPVDLTDTETAAASTGTSKTGATFASMNLDGVTTLLEAMDRIMQVVPMNNMPSQCAFVAVVEGDTHDKLGLFSGRRWASCVEAVRRRCQQRLLARARDLPVVAQFSEAYLVRDWAVAVPVDVASTTAMTTTTQTRPDGWLTAALSEMLRQLLEWLCTSGPSSGLALTVDASQPVLATGEALSSTWRHAYAQLLDAALAVNPLLWTATFREPDAAQATRRAVPEADANLKGFAKLRAERDAARDEWRERAGRCVTFSVPLDHSTTDPATLTGAKADDSDTAVPFRHVLLLQKPVHVPDAPTPTPTSLAAQDPISTAAAMEGFGLEADDVRPLPIGAQLHLYPDRGDAAYVDSVGLRNTQGTVLHLDLDDYLHEDGELFVQLGPVEGVPFTALDAFIAHCASARSASKTAPETTETTETLLHAALEAANRAPGAATDAACARVLVVPPQCEGSRSRFMYPRVLFRRPTGSTTKQNPLAKAHAAVHTTAPSAHMLASAARALSYLSAHVHRVPSSERTVSPADDRACAALAVSRYTVGPAPEAGLSGAMPGLEQRSLAGGGAEKRCAWCGRARDRLLRCSGCRAVHYCCAAHQALDWKSGSHKGECTVFLHAQMVQERVLNPLVHAAAAAAVERTSCSAPHARRLAPHASVGWSYAASVMAFVASLAPAPSSAGPLCVHVVGLLNAHIDDFLSALGSLTTAGPAGSVRLLVCVPDLASDRRNEVWSSPSEAAEVDEETTIDATGSAHTHGRLRLLPETGVLGDVWRQHRPQHEAQPRESSHAHSEAAATAAVVRLVGAAYHVWHDTAGAAALERLPATSALPRPLSYAVADGVVLFGPLDGSGLGYLTAAVDTVAEHDLYRCAVRAVDSAFVGTVRTENALAARAMNNERLAHALRMRVEASRHTVPAEWENPATATTASDAARVKKSKTIDLYWDVTVNAEGFGPDGTHLICPQQGQESGHLDDDDASDSSASKRVPPALNVVNGFYFDVPAQP